MNKFGFSNCILITLGCILISIVTGSKLNFLSDDMALSTVDKTVNIGHKAMDNSDMFSKLSSRNRRSVTDEENDSEEDRTNGCNGCLQKETRYVDEESFINFLKNYPWALVPITTDDGVPIRHTRASFVQLFGRKSSNDEKLESISLPVPPFSPRLGRRSDEELKPRLNRGSAVDQGIFKPRLGRGHWDFTSKMNKRNE